MQKRQHFVWVDGVAYFGFGIHKGRCLKDVAALDRNFLVCNSRLKLGLDSDAYKTYICRWKMPVSSACMCRSHRGDC